jgi:hypothetical protein
VTAAIAVEAEYERHLFHVSIVLTLSRSDKHRAAGINGSREEKATRYARRPLPTISEPSGSNSPEASLSPSINFGRTKFHNFWAYSSYQSAWNFEE